MIKTHFVGKEESKSKYACCWIRPLEYNDSINTMWGLFTVQGNVLKIRGKDNIIEHQEKWNGMSIHSFVQMARLGLDSPLLRYLTAHN